MSALEIVGAVTVGLLGMAISILLLMTAFETIRATRQAARVARYLYGRHWRSKFRIARFWRYFLIQIGHQFGGGEFKIGRIVFPADPSKPLQRTWSA